MPEYEKAVHKKNSSGKYSDDLNFESEELLILEGTAHINFGLKDIMNEHYLTNASLTTVVREMNLSLKPQL